MSFSCPANVRSCTDTAPEICFELPRESLPSADGPELDISVRPRANGYDLCQNGAVIFLADEQLDALNSLDLRLSLGGVE